MVLLFDVVVCIKDELLLHIKEHLFDELQELLREVVEPRPLKREVVQEV